MSKHLTTPAPRLICFGGAKLCTNAIQVGEGELDPHLGFGE